MLETNIEQPTQLTTTSQPIPIHIHKYITSNDTLNNISANATTTANTTSTNHTVRKVKKTKKQIYKNLTTSEVIDNTSYDHFKHLISISKNLCKGQTHNKTRYKVHTALSKEYSTLQTKNHYKTLYMHTPTEIIAYIAVKLYKTDGGFMFIHKLCSNGGGYGTTLMNIILEEARAKHVELGITYLSLTTHNLDLIDYYKTFNPTRIEVVDSPGTKRKIPKKVAYMIWQLSPNMPYLSYS